MADLPQQHLTKLYSLPTTPARRTALDIAYCVIHA
jgi:hypothetical protein